MIRRLLLAFAAATLVAGCASNVKLDDVPVVDKTGTAVGTTPATVGTTGGATPGGSTQSEVKPVVVDPMAGQAQGPVGVGRVVFFDYDSYVIKPEFQALIESHARFLKANGGRKIAIEGHTDERGGREYNLALGQKRSEAVRRSLALLGVTDSQIEAVSFGKEKPADNGASEDAWAKNRRAEIAYR